MFEIPAQILSWFYGLTGSYIIAIAFMAAIVMAITTPLTLKSTKGMLEMQRIAPEMRKLQNEHRNDRQKLNEEMMKLYQEHKVNPMASCLPIVAQMPVFIVMFRVLRGMTYRPTGSAKPVADATFRVLERPDEIQGFIPRFLSVDSDLYQSLYGKFKIPEIGLDLGLSPYQAITDNAVTGVVYALLVVVLGLLYFGQQRMVAARATLSPTMSPTQQKVMQYLPVVFAVFQIFFLTALVIYYIFQTLLRILQQYYITRKFYGNDESLGRQAQRASEAAREESKKNGETGGLFAQAKRDLMGGADTSGSKKSGDAKRTGKGAIEAKSTDTTGGARPGRPGASNKRVTPPKARPTAPKGAGDSRTGADSKNGAEPPQGKGRPTPSRKQAESSRGKPPRSSRPKPSGKKKR